MSIDSKGENSAVKTAKRHHLNQVVKVNITSHGTNKIVWLLIQCTVGRTRHRNGARAKHTKLEFILEKQQDQTKAQASKSRARSLQQCLCHERQDTDEGTVLD